MTLPADTRIIFSETALRLPDEEIPYEELFYRQSDVIIPAARAPWNSRIAATRTCGCG